jgi:hypothetical protein
MKKIALLFLVFSGVSGLNGQVLFYEDFDGIPGPTAGGAGTYAFPAGWFLRNVDNRTPDAQVSYVNEAWERREDFGQSVIDSMAFSNSWYSPVGPADDWMWTPQIATLPSNAVLTWNARSYDPSYPESYEVRIMTSGPPTGGTGVIGNQVTNSTVVFSTTGENASWTTHSINLSAYTGQSVYIGFRNVSNDKFLLVIDDVKVEVQVNIDAQLTYADTVSPYTLTPLPQAAPLIFNGTLRNNGLVTLSAAYAEVNVFNGANLVYTATSTATSVVAGATTNWTINSYTPNSIGSYTVQFIAKQSNGTDQVPSNDTLYEYFEIVDTTYARDDGMVTGGLGIGVGNGYLGQSFQVLTSDTLTSVSFYVTRGYTGRKAAVVIWNTVSGVPNAIITGTDTILYPDDSARFYTIPVYNEIFVLSPGTYVITAIEFDSTLQLGHTNSIFTNNTVWVNWVGNPFGTWANLEDFGPSFATPQVIRPNFGNICADNLVMATSTSATCISCPDGSATATTSGTSGTLTYTWTPSVGVTPTVTNLVSGAYTVTVTDAFGCVSMTSVLVPYDTCTNLSAGVSGIDASCAVCADGSATAIVSGSNGPVSYLWSDGGTTATISNLLPGTYTVTITDSLGCSHVDSVIVNFTTGLASMNSTWKASVSPNPNTGQFIINAGNNDPGEIKIEIVNPLGQLVFERIYTGGSNENIEIDLGRASAGIYMVKITTGDSVSVVPVQVQ